MGEKISLEDVQKRYKVTPTYHTESQLDAFEESLRRVEQQRQQTQRPQPTRLVSPIPEVHINGRNEKEPNNKRRILLRTGAGIAIAAATLGMAYAGNAFDSQTRVQAYFNDLHDNQSPDTGFKVNAAELKGERSLALDQCMGTKAVFAVFTIDGYMPLVPLVTTDKNPTPSKVPEYLSKKKIIDEGKQGLLTQEQVAKLKPFTTKSHYTQGTLNDMPLALTICENPDKTPITKNSAGEVTNIDRTQLLVSFEDPYGLTKNDPDPINIHYGLQVNGARKVKLQPNHAEYLTFPTSDLLIAPTVAPNLDTAFNASVAAIKKAMDSPTQHQVLLAAMEAGAIKKLDADGTKLQDQIDNALYQRLGIGATNRPNTEGLYTTKMDTQADPNQLIGLDKTQEFHITNVKVQYGSIDLSHITPIPSPSPTSTATPAP